MFKLNQYFTVMIEDEKIFLHLVDKRYSMVGWWHTTRANVQLPHSRGLQVLWTEVSEYGFILLNPDS